VRAASSWSRSWDGRVHLLGSGCDLAQEGCDSRGSESSDHDDESVAVVIWLSASEGCAGAHGVIQGEKMD
jgi:hypothetical protein